MCAFGSWVTRTSILATRGKKDNYKTNKQKNKSEENLALENLVLPPAPSSPIQDNLFAPPITECSLASKTPGSERHSSVIACPDPVNCIPRSPNISVPESEGVQHQLNTPSWDNYNETPEYFLSSQWRWQEHLELGRTYLVDSPAKSFTSCTDPFHLDDTSSTSSTEIQLRLENLRSDNEPIHKIQLVSTDCSELPEYSPPTFPGLLRNESDFLEDSLIESADQIVTMDTEEVRKLEQLGREVEDELGDLDPAEITRGQALHIEGDLEKIWKMKNELRNRIRYLVAPLADMDTERVKWENYSKTIVNKVVKHKRDVWEAVERLCPSEVMSAFQRKTLELQELDIKEKKAARIEAEKTSTKAGWAEAVVKLKAFKDNYNDIVAELGNDQSVIKERDDVTISHNMQQLQLWKKIYSRAVSNFREYERLTGIYGEEKPEVGELLSAKEDMETLKEAFEKARDEIEEEDRKREIFSTHKQVGEKLDYPRFAGAAHEDFIKYKDKMIKAFRRNGVGRSDQVEKLRKSLSGFALSLVPEHTENIDKAFETLKTAFGDPKKVLEDRMAKLKSCGDFPPDKLPSGKPGFRKQEEWYLNIEGILSEVIDLGGRNEDLAYHAFSEQTFNFVLSLFPPDLVVKLADVEGNRKEQMEALNNKLANFRIRSQKLGKIFGDKTPPGPASTGQSLGKKNDHPKHSITAQAGAIFSSPQRNDKCRVCTHLQLDGKTGLFDNHLSIYPTGCPLFAEMSTNQRKSMANKVKLCFQCMDPELVWDITHKSTCRVEKAKIRGYTCTSSRCKTHMWLCNFHQKINKADLEKQKMNLQKKGIVFNFASTMVHSSDVPKVMAQFAPVLSIEEAMRDLTRMEKRSSTNQDIQVSPPPMGQPMFLFFHIKGKKKGANIFFDKGCSTACFREGIPGKELNGKILAKGPFQIKGVGGMEAKANDEWLVSVETDNGGRQLIKGLTVDHVTADFPLIDVSIAAEEIKRDLPEDTLLQQCKVPRLAGGVTDALLGIHYSLIHPVPVHTLESGLTLYRSKLVSHTGGYNAMVGGPHSSFECLSEAAGNVGTMVAQFVSGLERYKSGDWSAPRLPYLPLTTEEVAFAKNMNATEVEILAQYRELENLDEMEKKAVAEVLDTVKSKGEEIVEEIEVLEVKSLNECGENVCPISDPPHINAFNNQHKSVQSENITMTCSDCNISYEVYLENSDEAKKAIKNKFDLMESGLEIDYRCVKCRDCSTCKNADQSERTSLREEQEKVLVKNSVCLDWEQKKIICSLPNKGSESDFLSSNKDRALKVLDSQCKKWYKDTVNKEMIEAAFKKLFDTGDTRLMNELTEEELEKFETKPVQYFIPWRVVYNDSPTTPVRPVFDASSQTRKRADGTGGKSLNEYVVKGKVETLNLVRLALGFSIGLFAVTGDLSQFYYSFKLKPDQWNLQRFLWREGLNPDGPVLEGVIGALIYGVTCVSAQTETSMEEIAEEVKDEAPVLADFIKKKRYVDDMGKSAKTREELIKLVKEADTVFGKLGLRCHAWVFSGLEPPEVVKMKGGTVKIAGQRWTPETDSVEIPIPLLHFGKKQRGRLPGRVKIFEGEFGDLENFVPRKLTKRKLASKVAALYDLMGKFAPVLAGLKLDLRIVNKVTEGWDDPVPDDLRNKWIQNFWTMEKLRGIKFNRARMPGDAVDERMRIITAVDAAENILMMGVWGGFRRNNGMWSCQHIIGRALLADEEGTIPKKELSALCGGANLTWVVKKALSDWIESSIVVADSEIALCWTITETKPLSIYHRNRSIQIRRSVNLDELYHVKTEFNPSDCGTRPSSVSLSDIGPGSKWEEGEQWMTMDTEVAMERGFIKSVRGLKIREDQEVDFKKGLIYEKVPDLLTRGHQVCERRVELIEKRAEFSKYVILPTKYSFPKLVRIMSMVAGFVSKCRKGRKRLVGLMREEKLWFGVFTTCIPDGRIQEQAKAQILQVRTDDPRQVQAEQDITLLSYFTSNSPLEEQVVAKFKSTQNVLSVLDETVSYLPSDKYINMALLYLYRKAALEAKEFVKRNKLDRIAVEKEGILLSVGRILDDMNFQETAELPGIDLGRLGVKVNLPVIERHSPLAYCVAEHIHWDLAKHRGPETCNRMSLENVFIIQGATLFKELSDDCIRCKMKRKKFLEAAMGPISESQLCIAPPCWMVQADLFGPITVFVPGFERNTRNRQVLQAKCWVLTAVCPTTRLVNLQTMESSKAAGWIDAFTRLSCEVGTPKHVFIDQDSAGMSALKMADIELRDLQLRLSREKGISFSVCGVGGHDRHGQVERVIRSVQESLKDSGLGQKILHATGLQTLCKLVESQYNNLPLGFHYSRAADNTPLLRIISPNMLRTGRSNQRSMEGPVRLPENRKEMLKQVEETYLAWFKIWVNTLVPKLMYTPKWFKSDKDLEVGNLVYFKKDPDTEFDTKWVIGIIDEIERSRDGVVRIVVVKYFNGTDKTPQFTKRTIRKLVKLWSVEDVSLMDDIAEMNRKFGKISGLNNADTHTTNLATSTNANIEGYSGEEHVEQGVLDDYDSLVEKVVGDQVQVGDNQAKLEGCKTCCCYSHHQFSFHYAGGKFLEMPTVQFERVVTSIATAFMDETTTDMVKTNVGNLEDFMMSVGTNLDEVMQY